MTDLWPEDIKVVTTKAPVTILREQASLLGQKTSNIVTAEVQRVTRLGAVEPGQLQYIFYIVGPAMDNYRYRLFTISHDIEMYPARISLGDAKWVRETFPSVTPAGASYVEAKSEEEFLEFLGAIFRSQRTRQVIGAILAQSGVEPGESA